ncbi:AfsR/SARP family transcriptional regulator [Streptomyces sp. SID486]|uniref:AfsR/SARP family transcriptional regulator n=1 Tax=Streptomyces sp. SID486 TaxID=2690264 RepID=UPI00235166BA|nr:AfsR/SARP family transcriptional regulator [Streptomyces sp. SID486]
MCAAGQLYDASAKVDGTWEPVRARLGLLGPLRLKSDEVDEPVSVAPKIRTVLAMLAMHPDQAVPVSVLTRELWSEDPPVTAARTLQTYILNVRKLLAKAVGLTSADIADQVLVTQDNGYSLRSRGLRFDWVDFLQSADHGRASLRAGDSDTGIRELEKALGMWRGSVLSDVPTGAVLEARRLMLDECRLDTIEALIDARIEAGAHQRVIAELASLTSEHPFHEGLHAQYMRALALNGRRAAALEVFVRLRSRLIEEIGIEPGYPLHELQRKILNSHTVAHASLSVN